MMPIEIITESRDYNVIVLDISGPEEDYFQDTKQYYVKKVASKKFLLAKYPNSRKQIILRQGREYPLQKYREIVDSISAYFSSLRQKETEIPIKVEEPVKGMWISFEKCPIIPEHAYKVTAIHALTREKLPSLYTNNSEWNYRLPGVWKAEDELVANNNVTLFKIGNSYSSGQISKAMAYIRLAGDHLTLVNEHIKANKAKGTPPWREYKTIIFKDGRLIDNDKAVKAGFSIS